MRPGIAEMFRNRLLPMADVATPNRFELENLTGMPVQSMAQARSAIAVLHRLGPSVVLVTSLDVSETPADSVDLVASDGKALWRVRTPKLDIAVNGAGDAISALFFIHILTSGSAKAALEASAAATFGLLKRTAEAGSAEILTVSAQQEFVRPTQHFAAEAL